MNLPTILMIIVLAAAGTDRTDPRVVTEDELTRLLKHAKAWEVPQPDAESALVRVWAFRGSQAGSPIKDFYALGFVDPQDPGRALVGFDWWKVDPRRRPVPVSDLDNPTLDDIASSSSFASAHGVNFGLVTGIQLVQRGDKTFGVKLIEKSLAVDAGHLRSYFHSPGGESPDLMLARSCLAAELNRITSEQPDFRDIKRRVDRLLSDEPELRNKGTDAIVTSLQASVNHPRPAAGTLERTIDDYLLDGHKADVFSESKAERALNLLGFAAIPELLKQRHSQRFTNHLMQGFNNLPNYPMTAGQVIDSYLQELANNTIRPDRIHDTTLKDDDVAEWWKNAQTLGEKEYVRKFTLLKDRTGEWSVSRPLLTLANHRYPLLLLEFYETLLQTDHPSWHIADEISKSPAISTDQKRNLFRMAMASSGDAHRNVALHSLMDIDPLMGEAELLQFLRTAPVTTDGQYRDDQDAQLGNFVSASPNPEVWKAFRAWINRADLGMRMELINDLYPSPNASSEILKHFHSIYTQFQNDPSVRDESANRKFEGPSAGYPYRQISMRDFIHIHWARWLNLAVAPPVEWSNDSEWKTYRDTVHKAVLRDYGRRASHSHERYMKSDPLFCLSVAVLSLLVLILVAFRHGG